MTDLSRWPEADGLLEEALALSERERPAFVRLRAGHDPSLAAALDAVLAEAGNGDGFLEPGGALSGALFEDFRRMQGADDETEPAVAEGTTIGPYRVIRRIGRGGMGEVYRARDTRLSRDVALKILPDAFARDPARRARFGREARLLASVSHPGIGAIYTIEESDGVTALVLELVEGPTLADRLATGPVPIGEAVAFARQLADALDAAHQRGIVHRDLKPANLKLSADGIKVLDFGLAKALQPDVPDTGGHHPTLTHIRDGAGPVMGTAAYMSPEQARGLPADHRTDIWGFGCVLYEMLAGERVFTGDSTAEVLARVLEREPDFTRLPGDTPAPLRRLLNRCLRKDVRRRLAHIADARLELEDAVGGNGQEAEIVTGPSAHRSRTAAVAIAALVTGAALSGIVSWSVVREPAVEVMHVAIPLPDGDEVVTSQLSVVSLSPDGRTVVYRARRGGVMQFYRRSLERSEPTAIAGTIGATGVFMSPDGEWIGFNDSGGMLQRVPVAGGTPVRIADAPGGVAASWSAEGTVVFGGGTGRVLFRVPAAGGTVQAITTLDETRGDLLHTFPDVLPNGRDVLFTIVSRDRTDVAVTGLDGGPIVVLTSGKQPRVLPSGHLVFVREGALWAAPYDAARRALNGDPVPVLRGFEDGGPASAAQVGVAGDGSIVYVPPRVPGAGRTVVWVDRQGSEEALPLEPRQYSRATLSPDGTRVALAIADPENQDIWIHDVERGTLTRLTSDPAIDTAPVWSPDGRFVAFRSDRNGGGLFLAPADGAASPVRLTRGDGPIHTPYGFTPDGGQLLFSEFRSYRDQRIGAVSVSGGEIVWLVEGGFAEIRPQVSPDGRWLAYQADDSGDFEIYVRPFADVAARRWQVSSGGGVSPKWGPDGRELLYFSGGTLMRVPVLPGPMFSVPEPVVEIAPYAERLGPTFDVTADGRRVLVIRDGARADDGGTRTLLFVRHWVEDLRRLVPIEP